MDKSSFAGEDYLEINDDFDVFLARYENKKSFELYAILASSLAVKMYDELGFEKDFKVLWLEIMNVVLRHIEREGGNECDTCK